MTTSQYDGLVPVERTVRCDRCDSGHSAAGNSFLTFYGNVTVGLTGGIIGNSMDEKRTVTRGLVYCFRCVDDIIREAKA